MDELNGVNSIKPSLLNKVRLNCSRGELTFVISSRVPSLREPSISSTFYAHEILAPKKITKLNVTREIRFNTKKVRVKF